MNEVTQDWLKHIESVLVDNQGHRLTPVMINGLLYAMGTSIGAVEAALTPPVPVPAPKLVEPIWETKDFEDVQFLTCTLEHAIFRGLEGLHHEHWKQTDEYLIDGVQLEPNYARFARHEAEGRFQVFLMVDMDHGSGPDAVGNFTCFFEQSTHTGKLLAMEDALYVRKDFRNRGRATAFIDFIHESLRKAGVSEIRVTTKLGNPVGRLLQKGFGYQHTANHYALALDRPKFALREVKGAA